MLKQPRYRDRKYLNWVRTLNCIGCNAVSTPDYPNDPDHVNHLLHGIKAGKAPDNQVVPLCRKCHTLRHQKGARWFFKERLGRSVEDALELAAELFAHRFNDDRAKWACFGWRNKHAKN